VRRDSRRQRRIWLAALASVGLVLFAGVLVLPVSDQPVRFVFDDSVRHPDVHVSVDGTDLRIDDQGFTIRLKPGPHTIIIRRKQEVSSVKQFTVYEGNEDYPAIQISIEAAPLEN
jgi:hypothetical protein